MPTPKYNYLIWSNEHRMWWKPARRGYTEGLALAGRYTREEALQICKDALPTAGHLGVISEIPVREEDLREFLSGPLPREVIGRIF